MPVPDATVPVAYVAFRESLTPIAEPVTKFGGQPVWLDAPWWPLSLVDGAPLRFIAQVALDPRLFGEGLAARMAYVFLSEHLWDFSRWSALRGGPVPVDGAVVLQPAGAPPEGFRHAPLARGPSLVRRTVHRSGFLGMRRRHEDVPCEYAAELTHAAEPTLEALDALYEVDEEAFEHAVDAEFERTKVGGTPSFIQSPEYPVGPPCAQLLQLPTMDDLPFHLELGDGGTLHAFVDRRGARGGVVVQSH